MNAAGRLATFGAGLMVAFGGAYAAVAAVSPEHAVTASEKPHEMHGNNAAPRGGPAGLSLGQDGYVLSPISAPETVGRSGQFSFNIVRANGTPLVDFGMTHQKNLHLVVVRTDGSQFRHVHPTLDPTNGMWTTPWQWNAAGTYRVFADFQANDTDNAPALTLTRTVDVAGEFTPAPPTGTRRVDQVDGFAVSLDGGLVAGTSSSMAVTMVRDGKPVLTLEPYLGAFGHLVALRDGDLAFLHMHPMGGEPAHGQLGGPTVEFMAEAPTAGRYLLYLDFQVDGQVHTAQFVVDAARPKPAAKSQHSEPPR